MIGQGNRSLEGNQGSKRNNGHIEVKYTDWGDVSREVEVVSYRNWGISFLVPKTSSIELWVFS